VIRLDGELTPVVDCDVHEAYGSIDELLPYLDDVWARYFRECGFRDLPRDPYVATAHGGRRVDSWPPGGGPPGSDFDLMRTQLFDENALDFVILTGHFYRVSSAPQVDFATALASAYNDWLIDTWLVRDERLRASIQVALQDPRAAAREIDRVGQHPQLVQVLFPQAAERAYGDPLYHPVYEAAVRNALPIAIHPSGSSGVSPPPTVVGSWPRTYFEYHANFALAYQAQLTSLVSEGVFVKFPDLRVVLLEGGFAWVPHVTWTLDTHWRSLQLEVPWLTRPPGSYIREHVFFGTQPIVMPEDPAQLVQVMEMIHGDTSLVFASDYPHWDFDSPSRFLPKEVSAETRRRILGRTAIELYGLPEPVADSTVDGAVERVRR
jgi:uncharacterized protein